MIDRAVGTSPQAYARTGGVLYLFIIVAGLFGEFSRESFIVSGNPAATASNIMAHESLFRLGIAAELLSYACDVAVAILLYALLKPVSKNLALLAAFFRVACDIGTGLNKVNLFAVLFLLGKADYLKAFQLPQLQTLAYLSLRLHTYGFAITLVFFAFGLLVLGYLIFRSDYFPKSIGVLLMIACPCYLINSSALFVAPQYASMTFYFLLIPFIAEAALCLWLLVKGVNVPKWEARVRTGPA
jgi:hypothetical protein